MDTIDRRSRGFSLLELLIVIVLLFVMMGVVFGMVKSAIARSGNEQAKLDMFQSSREFMDQMARDLHQAGYPNPHNFALGILTAPFASDHRAAVGLVKVGDGDLWFEGDVDGNGTVSLIQYHLDPSTSGGCPCLRRSKIAKADADPMAQAAPVYDVEVQGVQNTAIFSAYVQDSTGTPVGPLPLDFDNNSGTMATIDTIKAVLTVQSTYVDPETKEQPITTLITTVRLNNCSQAQTGLTMSCQ
jgi:prepilin-type N-terminal cleavage/methylation domain-containing protein